MRFDFDVDTTVTGLNHFRLNDHVEFTTKQGNTVARGSGASRQVHTTIAQGLIADGILLPFGYFADINLEHPFWLDSHSVRMFCNFIRSSVRWKCQLPFHLMPVVLVAITDKPMCISDLIFYADKIDPVAAKNIAMCDIRDTGYDSKTDAYRAICMRDQAIWKIYNELGRCLRHILKRKGSIRRIDEILSGPYCLTYQMVQEIMTIYGTKSQQRMFMQFIQSMTEQELRALLLTFGNTTSLNVRYTIHIADMTSDIQISVCSQSIFLSSKLFNDDGLQHLKVYFSRADDKIRDGYCNPMPTFGPEQSPPMRFHEAVATMMLITLVVLLISIACAIACVIVHEHIMPAILEKALSFSKCVREDILQVDKRIKVDEFVMELLKKRIDENG